MTYTRAQIQRRHRTRRDSGLICLRALVNEVDAIEELIVNDYLDPRDRDDRKKVEEAFQRARIKILPSDR